MINLVSAWLFLAALPALGAGAPDAIQAGEASRMPEFVALLPNINEFGRFADGGPDGNWYVGSNNAWVVQLPPAPIGEYTRAFIGAKLGRAKTRPKPGKTFEREVIPGKIYIAISQKPAFSPEQSFFLAEAADLPLEPDPRVYMPGAGQSEWFWAEVPPGLVNSASPNYLIVWSPTDYFITASSAPILAAADVRGKPPSGGARAWNNRSIQGVPPRRPEGTLETPINTLLPGLAIKLVPANDASVTIHECAIESTPRGKLVSFSVEAENPETAWVESSQDQLDWERVSGFVRKPPYMVTLAPGVLPARGAYVRAVAKDILGNVGACDPVYASANAP